MQSCGTRWNQIDGWRQESNQGHSTVLPTLALHPVTSCSPATDNLSPLFWFRCLYLWLLLIPMFGGPLCFCRIKKLIALYSIHVVVSLGEEKVVGDAIFSPFHLHLGDKHVSGERFYLFFIKSVCYSSTLAHPLFFTLANCIAPADKSKGNLICPPPRLTLAKLFWLRLLFSTGIGRWKKQQQNKLIIFRWAPIRMGLMEGRRYRKGSIYSLQAPHC